MRGMETMKRCEQCNVEMPGAAIQKKFCSRKCKTAHYAKRGGAAVEGHDCRSCGKWFPIGPGQYDKWIFSPECRRARTAKIVREFHERMALGDLAGGHQLAQPGRRELVPLAVPDAHGRTAFRAPAMAARNAEGADIAPRAASASRAAPSADISRPSLARMSFSMPRRASAP